MSDYLGNLAAKSLDTVEVLEGGFGRCEALNHPTTGERGMEEARLPYINYQQLEEIAQSNPDLVLVDVRGEKGPFESSAEGERHTDLSKEFPGVKTVKLTVKEKARGGGKDFSQVKGLKNATKRHAELYVLIDRGDGSAEDVARLMKGAGIKRFVILAGHAKPCR